MPDCQQGSPSGTKTVVCSLLSEHCTAEVQQQQSCTRASVNAGRRGALGRHAAEEGEGRVHARGCRRGGRRCSAVAHVRGRLHAIGLCKRTPHCSSVVDPRIKGCSCNEGSFQLQAAGWRCVQSSRETICHSSRTAAGRVAQRYEWDAARLFTGRVKDSLRLQTGG